MRFGLGLIAAISLLLSPGLAEEKSGILGIWTVPSGKARVEIFTAQDGTIEGKIRWLKEPVYDSTETEVGQPKHDRNNPDPARRGEFILGLTILRGFHRSGDHVWSGGTIYDPENGKTYRCKLTLNDSGTLKVRGFIGISLIGRTEEWARYRDQK